MFERFTDKARTAVIAARAEAAERGDQIRPVYLLHAATPKRRPHAVEPAFHGVRTPWIRGFMALRSGPA